MPLVCTSRHRISTWSIWTRLADYAEKTTSRRRIFNINERSISSAVLLNRKPNTEDRVVFFSQDLRWKRNAKFSGSLSMGIAHQSARMKHHAFVALGSNLGDRVAMIEQACKEMDRTGKIKVLRTSSLWETKAMYVLDQDKFVNGVCEVETTLSPMELLDELQGIENRMGRVKIIDKGPRNIDLDIILFDNEKVLNDRLQIPHKLMLEREFVLRPLCELIPNHSLPAHVDLPAGSFQYQLSHLPKSVDPLSPLTPLSPNLPNIPSQDPQRKTHVMTILNLTPDSFSDGGKHFNRSSSQLAETIRSHIASGATILDLGGQSTRPGAPQVSAQEELERVLPAIEAIKTIPEAANVAISVDTYRADVAEATIKAGAHIVNDVSAGLLDERMLSTVAELGATVCLMHMRGTPETMSSLTDYPDGIISGVAKELLERVRAAEEAGIRRWRIILDPGIGFAKNQEQNLELLKNLDKLRNWPGLEGFPWLIGASRKAFVGRITGVKEARERVWGTAAAVTAAVQGGADIVRVHDAKEMGQVVKMADAIWRQ